MREVSSEQIEAERRRHEQLYKLGVPKATTCLACGRAINQRGEEYCDTHLTASRTNYLVNHFRKRIVTFSVDGNEAEKASRGFIFGCYGNTAAHYDELIDEAIKDFPHLTRRMIGISRVKNSELEGWIVISFPVKAGAMPEGYEIRDKFDFEWLG